ncbi:MAG: OadG family protein [Bacteroidales bacterium]|jgi:hypothetical protein|nr:OadG family protein [Bacteroidales bacterium]
MKKLIIIPFLLFSMSISMFSQTINDLKINEMLIDNVDNFADEYGRHVPWVEIFNSAYNSVNVAECFLTNDTTGLYNGSGVKNWYRIPKGDPLTLIAQRSFVVFYMDNVPKYGTFHVNFDPSLPGSSNYVALISSNGKTLIDIFEFPEILRHSSQSYGYFTDGIEEKEDENGNMVSNKVFLDYFTPGSTNFVDEGLTKAEKVQARDKYGFGLAIIAMVTVFSALAVIYLLMKIFGKVARTKFKLRKTKVPNTLKKESQGNVEEEDITGEESAALSLALHLYFTNQHEKESGIITIDSSSAHFSPWSQKHLVLKQVNRKR